MRRCPFGSISRLAPPQAAPTRPLDTDGTGLHGPSAPQAACHGSTPHWPDYNLIAWHQEKVHDMFNKIERPVGFIAGIVTIGQTAWVVYGEFNNLSIPLWLYLSSVLATLIAGIILGRWAIKKSKSSSLEAFKEVGRIAFDYLPDSPANNGWTLHVDGENGNTPIVFICDKILNNRWHK